MRDKPTYINNQRHPISLALITISSCLLFYTAMAFVLIFIQLDFPLTKHVSTLAAEPSWFKPEPLERFIFLSGILSLPVFQLLLAFPIVIFFKAVKLSTVAILDRVLGYSIFPALIFLLIGDYKSFSKIFDTNLILGVLPITSFFVFFTCHKTIFSESFRNFFEKNKKIFIILAKTAVCLVVISILLFGMTALDINYRENSHFQAVLFPSVQVFLDKTLMADFIAQYGLYTSFLNPLFQILGLSAPGFALTMSFINVCCYLAIWVALNKFILNQTLAVFCWITIIFLSYPYCYLILDAADPYFQYWPIRTVFPITGLIGSIFYFQKPNKLKYFSLSLCLSFGIFWNIDSGIVAAGAWLISVVYFIWLQNSFVKSMLYSLAHIIFQVVIFIVIFCIWSLLLKINKDTFGLWGEQLSYQKLFYVSGFYMLPMKLFGWWILPILTYLSGLSFSIVNLFRKGKNLWKPTVIVYLSVLGCGLFSYYQGRSHPRVLLNVIMPAIFLISIYLNYFLSKDKTKFSTIEKSLFAICFSFFILSNFSFIINFPQAVSRDLSKVSNLSLSNKNLAPAVELLKKYIKPGEEIIILSKRSAEIYLATKSTFHIFPSFVDTFSVKMYQKLEKDMISNKKIILVDQIFAKNSGRIPQQKRLFNTLNKYYTPQEISSDKIWTVYAKQKSN